MPFSYALPGSDSGAGGIGWFNFETLSIRPGETVTGLTGTLIDGTVVTFDLSLIINSGVPRAYVATQPPVNPDANFGTTGYIGITGNVALYGEPELQSGVFNFIIDNIAVIDINGNPISDYTVLLADAEVTNFGETWTWGTNGGPWSITAALGSPSPTLVGIGTDTARIVGIEASGTQTAYVLATQSPTQLELIGFNNTSNRQAFAIGFAVTHISFIKDIGKRINASDQFILDIAGSPSNQITTNGSAVGIQPQRATVFAIPGNTYTLSEAMAPGSASTLSSYFQTLSSMNSTPGGTIPPAGNLPINFIPALGDDVTFIVLNTPSVAYEKSVDKAYADIGEMLTYTVTIRNFNSFSINNVLLTDETPIGTIYTGALQVSAPYTGSDPATGITITSISANSAVTVSWQVQVISTPPLPLTITNTASITMPDGSTTKTNEVETQIRHADLVIVKKVDILHK